MTEVGEDTFSQTPTLVQSAKLYNLFLLAKCLKISDESPLLRQVRFYFEASAPRQHLPPIDALYKKQRARHIYDIIFMLRKKFEVNQKFLKKLGFPKGPFETITLRIQEIPQRNLKNWADSLRPFLFEEEEAKWVENAKEIIPRLMDQY